MEGQKMKVLVVNGSPAGENSITLQTVLYIAKRFPKAKWEYLHVGRRIKAYEKDFSECAEALRRADLILFCYPVYTFLVPAQLHRFLELIKENNVDLSGKAATQISTSKHFYDTTAHQFIRENCDDLGLKTIRGLSADMEDLLHKKGQKEADDFFRFVCWSMKNGVYEPVRTQNSGFAGSKTEEASVFAGGKSAAAMKVVGLAGEKSGRDATENSDQNLPGKYGKCRNADKNPGGSTGKIVIVADYAPDFPDDQTSESECRAAGHPAINLSDESTSAGRLASMINRFISECPLSCEVVNIREFPFAGGCLGCFHCAADGTCIYKDGFDEYLRNHIQASDAIVYAFTIRDHSMGSRFKMFDDRQFCNGHRTVTMGKPVGYLVDGVLSCEYNLQTLMESRSQVGGNFLAGIASNEADIRSLALTLDYAIRHRLNFPANFYGVGGMKIFRDLIWQMQGMMKEDHRFYKEHGFYDFPQKQRGKMIGMYLVGAMMTNPSISKKLGGKMTEGMLMPYKKVLESN